MRRLPMLLCAFLCAGVAVLGGCGSAMSALIAVGHDPDKTVQAKLDLSKCRVAVLPFASGRCKRLRPFESTEGTMIAEALESRLRVKLRKKKVKFVVTQPARKYFRETDPEDVDFKEVAELLGCDIIIYGDLLKTEGQVEHGIVVSEMTVSAYDARDNTIPVKEEVSARFPEARTASPMDMQDAESMRKGITRASGNAAALLFHKHEVRRELGTEKQQHPELR